MSERRTRSERPLSIAVLVARRLSAPWPRRPRAARLRPRAPPPRRRLAVRLITRPANHQPSDASGVGRLERDCRASALRLAAVPYRTFPSRGPPRHDDHRPQHGVSPFGSRAGELAADACRRRHRRRLRARCERLRICAAHDGAARRRRRSWSIRRASRSSAAPTAAYGGQRSRDSAISPLRRVVRAMRGRSRCGDCDRSGARATRPAPPRRARARVFGWSRTASTSTHATRLADRAAGPRRPRRRPTRRTTRSCFSASAAWSGTRASIDLAAALGAWRGRAGWRGSSQADGPYARGPSSRRSVAPASRGRVRWLGRLERRGHSTRGTRPQTCSCTRRYTKAVRSSRSRP